MDNSENLPVLITGVAGFIASQVARSFIESGRKVWGLDEFETKAKRQNWEKMGYSRLIDRTLLEDVLRNERPGFSLVIHLGARTDTRERDALLFDNLIRKPSEILWKYCSSENIPLIYASSAATYGDGRFGYSDSHEGTKKLIPLNEYAKAKHAFDLYALSSEARPPFWYGLKFFNVYGPGEAHKGGMASVLYHGYRQIEQSGTLRLFKSHRTDVKHGEQKRDFIWVGDVVSVIKWLEHSGAASGLYNLGFGVARSFNDLGHSLFSAMSRPVQIEYVPMPEDLQATYQYFTCADIGKLRDSGYVGSFTSLEEGAKLYLDSWQIGE
jgi:ADP-L-glycero-D-manno-heptose 6-epimerase